MTIIFWALQIGIAFFCVSGAVWRLMNFEAASKDVPSIGALPRSVWTLSAVIEIVGGLVLALGLFVAAIGAWVSLAATILAIEFGLLTLLHLRYFVFKIDATNPAIWTFVLAVLSAVVAYCR